jgi:hypothetical protein
MTYGCGQFLTEQAQHMTDISTSNPTPAVRRPRQRQRVPEVKLPNGDVLVPRADFVGTLGVTERTARRWNFPTTYLAGVAFVQRDASLQIIAASVHRRNQPAAARPRRGTRKNRVK